MSIRRSAAPEIQLLVDALSSADDVKRESAIARLAIIGGRAMDRLTAAYASSDRDTRVAILQAAEAIADPRAIPLAVRALSEGGDLARAGTLVLRALLDSSAAAAAAGALDVLVATALDRAAERAVRSAAFDALQDMPPAVRGRVAEALQDDPDVDVKARAANAPRDAAATEAVWKDALEGTLPEDPAIVREAVRHRAAAAPLSALQKLVESVREREAAVRSQSRREAWRHIRGSIHQALALRGSRVAVYDLRETVASEGALPSSFLTALHVVGDESCLEPLAASWMAAGPDAGDVRQQLESAFQAIVNREKISARSALLKRIATRYPEAALSMLSRTTPRRSPRRRT
jgi:hypothetical protein